jgi:hypothetical protein
MNHFELGRLRWNPVTDVTPEFDEGPSIPPRVVLKISDAFSLNLGEPLSIDGLAAAVGFTDFFLIEAVRAFLPDLSFRQIFECLVDLGDLILRATTGKSRLRTTPVCQFPRC